MLITPFLFMILIVDNNDSFTYNIVEMVRSVSDIQIKVIKSVDLIIDEVANYDLIILSPGPSLPQDFPILQTIIETYKSTIPILGICLGHQAICTFFGAHLVRSKQVMHGIDSIIETDPNSVLFKGMTQSVVGRYHSWYVTDVPDTLKIVAKDNQGVVMAVEHNLYPLFGVQFHPESYITAEGKQIIKNFIDAATF